MKKRLNMFQPVTNQDEEVVIRNDSINLDSTYFTDEGYLIDKPIVTTIGVFEYTNPDGTIRRELRLPEEVFHPDSLTSYRGKPIIVTHKAGVVDKDNVTSEIIGTILTSGEPDGSNVRAGIIIHGTNTLSKVKCRELSLGYSLKFDPTPGVWNGQPYDGIQRKIRVNHLALVRAARAGEKARLNVDGKDEELDSEGGTAELDKQKRTDADEGADRPKNLVERWRERRDFRRKHQHTAKPVMEETNPSANVGEAQEAFAQDALPGTPPVKKKEEPPAGNPPDNTPPNKEEPPVNNPSEGDQPVKEPEKAQDQDGQTPPTQKTPFESVRGNQSTRDNGMEPATLEEALMMIAEQDGDIQQLLDYVEQLLAKVDFIAAEEKGGKQNHEETEETNLDEKEKTGVNPDNRADGVDIEAMVAQKVDVLRTGDRLNLDGLESMSIVDAKKAVIQKVNPELRLDGKSDAYIDAAYDLAKERISGSNIQKQQMFSKKDLNQESFNVDGADLSKADEARKKMIDARLGKA